MIDIQQMISYARYNLYTMPSPSPEDRRKKQYNLLRQVVQRNASAVASALRQGEDPNFRTADGYTPLILAARHSDVAMVNLLLDYQADINAAMNFGQTALLEAATQRHAAVVEALLARGADTEAKNQFGMNALLTVCSNSRQRHSLEVAAALLQGKADANVESRTRFTPLMFAAIEGDEAMVRLLLSQGALRKVGDSLLTARVLAASLGHHRVVPLL
jgi:ankyrin repeat protein